MLTRPQAIGLTAALAVTAVLLLPAGLFAFWRRRVRREEAEAERQRLDLLEALELPLPPMGDEEAGRGKGKGKAEERLSVTSSIRPSWRTYLCRGKALTEEEIMGRSKVIARPAPPQERTRPTPGGPRAVDKGKGKARETTDRPSDGEDSGGGEDGAEARPQVASTSRAGRLMSKFSTDSESPVRK